MRVKANVAIFMAILFILFCCVNESKEEHHKGEKKSLIFFAEGYVAQKVGTKAFNLPLSNLFDQNCKTGCFLETKNRKKLRINFSKPVYVNALTFCGDESNIAGRVESQNYVQSIVVSAYSETGDIFPVSVKKFKLNRDVFPQKIEFDSFLLKVLKIKAIIIEADKKLENKTNQILWLTEVDFDYARESTFNATIDLNFLKKKYGGKQWSFSEEQPSRQEQVLANIIYYAVKGDKSAEKILFNYSPPQADEGEWASSMRDWYESTKTSSY